MLGCLVYGDPQVKYQSVVTLAANAGRDLGELDINLAVVLIRRIETGRVGGVVR